jgi:hypothetical protein
MDVINNTTVYKTTRSYQTVESVTLVISHQYCAHFILVHAYISPYRLPLRKTVNTEALTY